MKRCANPESVGISPERLARRGEMVHEACYGLMAQHVDMAGSRIPDDFRTLATQTIVD